MGEISIVIHTYNNEKILRKCLESVKDFDEIVICDMYSTDRTLEIAKEYNCKIVMHEHLGWADPARNFAIQQASKEWVLVVDSDEQITKELREYLYDFIKAPKDVTAIRIPRLNKCWGQALNILYPDLIVRFFKKDLVNWPPYVHASAYTKEGKRIDIDPKRKELAIIHDNLIKYEDQIAIINKYTNKEMEKPNRKKTNIYTATWKSFWIILEKFFFKGGIKDGEKGLIMAINFGIYKFVKSVKEWELDNE